MSVEKIVDLATEIAESTKDKKLKAKALEIVELAEELDEDGGEEGGGDDKEELVTALADLDEDELKQLAKKLKVKVGKKDDADTMAEAIADGADKDDILDAADALDIELELEESEEEEEENEEEEEENEEEEEEGGDLEAALGELSLKDLKALAKQLEIKVGAKDKEEAIIEKLLDEDEDDVIEAAEELEIDLELEEEEESEEEEEGDDELKDALEELDEDEVKELAKALKIKVGKKDEFEDIVDQVVEKGEDAIKKAAKKLKIEVDI